MASPGNRHCAGIDALPKVIHSIPVTLFQFFLCHPVEPTSTYAFIYVEAYQQNSEGCSITASLQAYSRLLTRYMYIVTACCCTGKSN